jgi:HAMP domain-containing protein
VPLDLTFVLWVGSLLLSAAAVVVFLWLMREEPSRETEDRGRKTNEDPGRPAD